MIALLEVIPIQKGILIGITSRLIIKKILGKFRLIFAIL